MYPFSVLLSCNLPYIIYLCLYSWFCFLHSFSSYFADIPFQSFIQCTVQFHVQITVSSSKNPRNGVHMDLVGHIAGFGRGAGNLLLTATCPHAFNRSVPSGKRNFKKRGREPEISQLVSARKHQFQVMFLLHMCHGVSTSCQYGEQRISFDKSHVYIPAPLQQGNLFPLNELSPPVAKMHPLLENSSVWRPRKRPRVCLSCIFTDRAAIFILKGGVRM